MKKVFQLRIDEPMFQSLWKHLFPGDEDEHGAVILAGVSRCGGVTRLLAREIVIARDGVDWISGTRGYRAFSARFVAEVSDRCFREKLCYLSVHNHRGKDEVSLSSDDIASHKRGYPALVQIIGLPVGGLVFAQNAAAGELWSSAGIAQLDLVTIVGPRMSTLRPEALKSRWTKENVYDRQSLFFGDRGQELLRNLKVGIVGLGGAGSLINEWLSRLGVGHIIAVDFDRIEPSNLPRVVGATRWDAKTILSLSRSAVLRKIGARLSKKKVHIARRVARRANPKIKFNAIFGNVLDQSVAGVLRDCDFIFWAADPIQTRLVFNALVQQYLIPGMQVGAKVEVEKKNGNVGQIFTASRPVLPFPGGGCLECNGLIPASSLQTEASTSEEKTGQKYVEEENVNAPSVITLNAVSCSTAVNDFLMMFYGLLEPGVTLGYVMTFPRAHEFRVVGSASDQGCPDCSNQSRSRRGRGDQMRLPCRTVGK